MRVLLLVLLALVTGCQSVGAKAYNLRELRNEDGSAKLEGRAMSDLKWSLSSGLQGLGVDSLGGGPVKAHSDPDGRTLEVLNELAEITPEDVAAASTQVELYAWLAIDDRYVLVRERCVLELGAAAQRLGVTEPEPPPRSPAPEAEVAAAVEAVYAATAALVEGDGGQAAWERLDATCTAVEGLILDGKGARRALRYVAELLDSDGVSSTVFRPLTRLAEDLQKTCVQRLLLAALSDERGWVRAAAQSACAPLGEGFRFLAFLHAIEDPDPEVQSRWLYWVGDYGLPQPTDDKLGPDEFGLDLSPDAPREVVIAEIERNLLVRVLEKTGPYNHGRVSAAACRAMGKISDAGFESLRFEDWADWYRARTEVIEP